MKNILITGSSGFVGKNLRVFLAENKELNLLLFDVENAYEELETMVQEADFIFHLAGVNRATDADAFIEGNQDFPSKLTALLRKHNKQVPVVISSSIQAEQDNVYGKSKLAGEKVFLDYAEVSGAPVIIYRLPNLFGKWCQPNYNSVVATFCHSVANGIDITVNDRETLIHFVYIDDLIQTFAAHLYNAHLESGYASVTPVFNRTLGEVADLIQSFAELDQQLLTPSMNDTFVKNLYSTYLSYLPRDGFLYTVPRHSDERGDFIEFVKNQEFGQIGLSTSRVGVSRGNHYHHTKLEKFLVLCGQARVSFRHVLEETEFSYELTQSNQIINIPPGYTHKIENIGAEEMVLVIWCNEIFDPEHPDTYFSEV